MRFSDLKIGDWFKRANVKSDNIYIKINYQPNPSESYNVCIINNGRNLMGTLTFWRDDEEVEYCSSINYVAKDKTYRNCFKPFKEIEIGELFYINKSESVAIKIRSRIGIIIWTAKSTRHMGEKCNSLYANWCVIKEDLSLKVPEVEEIALDF